MNLTCPDQKHKAEQGACIFERQTPITKYSRQFWTNSKRNCLCILQNTTQHHVVCCRGRVGALFLNCQEAVPIRITLEEMGHPQPFNQLYWEYQPEQSSNASPKQWTCGSIGLGIEAIRTNSTSIGNPVQQTGEIISQKLSSRPPHNSTPKLFARRKLW